MRPLVVPAILLVGLAACASNTTTSRYADELRQLADDCRDRGGVLSPTGRHSDRPQTDYACKIVGASRLPEQE